MISNVVYYLVGLATNLVKLVDVFLEVMESDVEIDWMKYSPD